MDITVNLKLRFESIPCKGVWIEEKPLEGEELLWAIAYQIAAIKQGKNCILPLTKKVLRWLPKPERKNFDHDLALLAIFYLFKEFRRGLVAEKEIEYLLDFYRCFFPLGKDGESVQKIVHKIQMLAFLSALEVACHQQKPGMPPPVSAIEKIVLDHIQISAEIWNNGQVKKWAPHYLRYEGRFKLFFLPANKDDWPVFNSPRKLFESRDEIIDYCRQELRRNVLEYLSDNLALELTKQGIVAYPKDGYSALLTWLILDSEAKKVVLCKCGCGRPVPPGRSIWATSKCKNKFKNSQPLKRVKNWIRITLSRRGMDSKKFQFYRLAENLFDQGIDEKNIREKLKKKMEQYF